MRRRAPRPVLVEVGRDRLVMYTIVRAYRGGWKESPGTVKGRIIGIDLRLAAGKRLSATTRCTLR